MFSSNSGTGLNHYRNVGVESLAGNAAPHKLVLMLFDGARAAIAQAKGNLERHEIAAKGKAISQAISIIDGGLKASLDLNVGGELAQNLSDLYVYMGQRLLHANIKNDVSALDEVATLLEQLGDAWRSIGAKPATANVAPDAQAQAARPAAASPAQTYKPGATAQASHTPAPPVQTPRPARAGPAQAYGSTTSFATAQAHGAVPASQPPAGRSAAGAPAAPTTNTAAATPSAPPANPIPAGPSAQSRRLAAAYGRI